MKTRRLLENVKDVKELANRLAKCPQVQALDDSEEKEAWTLAHSFSEIEESFVTLLDDKLPRLVQQELEPSEVYDVLLEIGEELRHILYHINDPKFYNYIQQEDGSHT